MRILFLSRWFPSPPDNGSKIRIFNILRQLSLQHEVALLSFGEERDLDNLPAQAALRAFCSSVGVIRLREAQLSTLPSALGFLSRQPRSFVSTYAPSMARAIFDHCNTRPLDLIIASQLQMMPYAIAVKRIPAVIDELELQIFQDAVLRAPTRSRWLRTSLTWLKLTDYVRRAMPRFAACTVVSEPERAILNQVRPDYHAVSVLPNALDLMDYEGSFGLPRPNSLVFSGALTFSANYDALRHFLFDIYPLIRRAVPTVELRVTGRTSGVDLSGLPSVPGVQFTGYLDDIRPVVAQSWASVVPLRIGGGTRLKILEAQALGTPVISTTKGAQGLDVAHGQNILIADDPVDFAAQVISVLRSPRLREDVALGGRRLVSESYNWRVLGQNLQTLVARAAYSPTEPGRHR